MMKAGLVEISWTLVFQIINTLILFLVLRRLLFKPVTAFMESRQNSIMSSIKEADGKNMEAEALKEQYAKKLAGAADEGRSIVEQSTRKAQDRASEIVKEAQDDASKMLNRAELEIMREKQKAMNAIKDDMAKIAVMAAGKIIDKNLDEQSHSQFIKEFIDEAGDAKWHN